MRDIFRIPKEESQIPPEKEESIANSESSQLPSPLPDQPAFEGLDRNEIPLSPQIMDDDQSTAAAEQTSAQEIEALAAATKQAWNEVKNWDERNFMEERSSFVSNMITAVDSLTQTVQVLSQFAEKTQSQVEKLRRSQDARQIFRKLLLPLAEWIQTWQEMAREQPEISDAVNACLDEASFAIEKNCGLFQAHRYRSSPGDEFTGERMDADGNVEETNDPALDNKIIESLGDGLMLAGVPILEEKVRAYRYVQPPLM